MAVTQTEYQRLHPTCLRFEIWNPDPDLAIEIVVRVVGEANQEKMGLDVHHRRAMASET